VEVWRFPLGAPLSGPLLSLGSRVVASVENGGIQALNLPEGQSAWKRDLSEPLAGGPVLFAGLVIQATTSGKIAALEPSSGVPRWTADLGEEIQKAITPTQERLLVALATGRVVSLDSVGNERWRVNLRGPPSTPVAACRGFAVVGTEVGTLEAYDRETGKRLWIFETGTPVRSPLFCRWGSIYFGTADYRFNAIRTNGRRRWSYRVGGEVTAAPFGMAGRIYFLCYDDYLYVLRARSGHLLQRLRMSHRLADDVLQRSDRIYLSAYTSARLMAFSLPDLGLLHEYKLELEGEWFTTPPVWGEDQVLIGYGRYEGRILALKEEVTPLTAVP